jgi:hypothetical protein
MRWLRPRSHGFLFRSFHAESSAVEGGQHQQPADDGQILEKLDELRLVSHMPMEYQRRRDEIEGDDQGGPSRLVSEKQG